MHLPLKNNRNCVRNFSWKNKKRSLRQPMESTLSGFVGDGINSLRFESPWIAHVIKYCWNVFSQVAEAVLFTQVKQC